ncbi:uncharacterized protein CCOS01_16712, partial [Colletotrichum costaricense]
WHLRGDGASLASSRPVPNDKLRKQDAKKSVFLSGEEASTYSCLCSGLDRVSTSTSKNCRRVDAFQPRWLKAGMCAYRNRERGRIPPRRLPLGGDASDIMEAKDRSTTEVSRGFGQISPLVSRVIMMARLLLVVTSRQGVAPLQRVLLGSG